MDVLRQVNLRRTEQTEPARAGQVQNSAGGYVFAVGDEARLRRFLILGTEGGTYYTSAKELTKDNADVLLRLAAENPKLVIDTVLELDSGNRAPKHNTLLFALAAVAGLADEEHRRAALEAALSVARTGTHLFTFLTYAEQFRGWGRGLRRFASSWYTTKEADALAYQLVKYRQRDGWTHRDVLRLAHPKGPTPEHDALYARVTGKEVPEGVALTSTYRYFEEVQAGGIHPALAAEVGLPWEALPTESLKDPDVWRALIEVDALPYMATMRNLPRLTTLGLLDDHAVLSKVVRKLTDPHEVKRGRVHPVNILVAARTYASGHSARGDSTWVPKRAIVDALDVAFYTAFGNVTPSGKRTLIALDVSGSMGSQIAGMPITAREASAAMALVTMATEEHVDVVAFTGNGFWSAGTSITELALSPRQRLDDVLRTVDALNFGRTDCALPMVWAGQQGRKYDAIHIWTDNETYAGTVHPFQALRQYRAKTGLDTRLVVAATTSTGFSIADAADGGMLDVVGFDSAAPQLIADFSAGRI